VPETLYPAYRDENLLSRYPFSDTASLLTNTGFDFGSATVIDAALWPIGALAGVCLTSIDITLASITLWFGDSVATKRAQAVVDPVAFGTRIAVTDLVARSAGFLVVDPEAIAALRAWPVGTHAFANGAAEFVASCVAPTPDLCVQGVDAGAGAVSGDVWLIGDQGVVLSVDSSGNIRVDTVGDPYFLRNSCGAGGSFTAPSFLQSINNVAADAYGSFVLAAIQSGGPSPLRFIPVADNTLKIEVIGRAQGAI
jgi:hypothetical protein